MHTLLLGPVLGLIVNHLMRATLHTHYTRTAQIYLVYTLLTFDLQQYFKNFNYRIRQRFPNNRPQLILYYLYQIAFSLNIHVPSMVTICFHKVKDSQP